MLILRGEQGVPMSLNQVCVCRRTPTFSSDVDGRVFLCPLEDVKREALDVKYEAWEVKRTDAVRVRR
jgi:hypothetical protein